MSGVADEDDAPLVPSLEFGAVVKTILAEIVSVVSITRYSRTYFRNVSCVPDDFSSIIVPLRDR